MKLTIGHLYPDLLNLYGDRGNIRCLQKRLQWRGIGAEVLSLSSDSRIDFTKLDLVLLGGGSDREQELACRCLSKQKEAFQNYVEQGGTVLAVCGGYQLLGIDYQTENVLLKGLGILDIHTKWKPRRLVGNIILHNPQVSSCPIVGFENHGGRTDIGSYTPFGKVISGCGNTETSGYEGIIYKNVIGTYLHGPLLPKNPEICDYLLKRALKQKYGASQTLGSLPDQLEHLANRDIVKRFAPRTFIFFPSLYTKSKIPQQSEGASNKVS